MKFTRAIAIPPIVLRLGLLGVSFGIAYRGQRLLETQEDLRLGWILFLVAAIPLYIAWFLGRRHLTASAREEADADTQAPAKNGSRPLGYVPDWAARGWRRIAPYCPIMVVVALAATLRFYKLGSLPLGVSFDEAQNGLEARHILHDPLGYHPIFIPGASQLPALFFYVFAVAMEFLGEGIIALRSTVAIFGILTVAAIYLLGRELFGHRVGLVAALLLAVMRWHLNFSRIAFHGIFGALFMVLALYFLVRGFKGRGWWNFVVSGVLIGIGLQSYYSFVFVPLIVILYWLHYAVSEGRSRLVPLASGLLLVGLASGLVVLPLARYALDHPDHVTQRARTVSITTDRSTEEIVETVVRSTKTHALMFNVQGDSNGRHNLPPLPMLDRFTGMLFVLGIIFALSRPHESRHFLLLCWLVLLMQPGIWSLEGEAPQGYRTFMITPAIALLAALPLGLLADIALEARSSSAPLGSAGRAVAARVGQYLRDNLGRAVAGAGLLFLLAQAVFLNYDTFFNKQLESPLVWAYFEPAETLVGRELDRFGPQEVTAYSSATLTNTPTSVFLATDAPSLNTIVFSQDIPFQSERGVLVFFDGRDHRDSEAFTWVQSLYPQAQFREYTAPGRPEPTVLHQAFIPANLIAASYGVDATYRPAVGGSPVVRQEKGLAADWRRETPVALPFSAEWSATLKVPESANKGLRVEAPGKIRLSLDGGTVAEGEGRVEITGDLTLGLHALKVEVQATGQGEVRLLWLVPEGDWTAVPESALFRPPIVVHGLTGSYYNLEDQASPLTPSAPPVQRRVDPYVAYRYHVGPVASVGVAFVVQWVGKLTVPEPGGYRLATDSRDEVKLLVDGQPYLSGEGYVEGSSAVTSGVHEIELRYAAYSGTPYVFFYWLPPEQPRVIVPFQYLSPQ